MTIPSTTTIGPSCDIREWDETPAVEPRFADLFPVRLPRGWSDETAGMSPDDVYTRYGRPPGPLRLGQWQCTDPDRPATRLGPQARNFRATLAVGDRITTAVATAGGPVAALTAMLHEHGMAVEVLRFHQLCSGQHTATFVQGGNGVRAEWAMGWAADSTESALRAVIACANRLSVG